MMPKEAAVPLIVSLVASAALAASSAQQTYGAGQVWQKNECNKIIDMQERQRCMKSTDTSYEDYRHQSEQAGHAP